MLGAGVCVGVSAEDAGNEEVRFSGVWVGEGVRKAFVGEGLSHIVEGAFTGIRAYVSSIFFSGIGVISISDCLSECREETESSHV